MPRVILPASGPRIEPTKPSLRRPRRRLSKNTSIACNRCRRYKSKCDGGSPCTSCLRKGHEACTYDTENSRISLRVRNQELERQIQQLALVKHEATRSGQAETPYSGTTSSSQSQETTRRAASLSQAPSYTSSSSSFDEASDQQDAIVQTHEHHKHATSSGGETDNEFMSLFTYIANKTTDMGMKASITNWLQKKNANPSGHPPFNSPSSSSPTTTTGSAAAHTSLYTSFGNAYNAYSNTIDLGSSTMVPTSMPLDLGNADTLAHSATPYTASDATSQLASYSQLNSQQAFLPQSINTDSQIFGANDLTSQCPNQANHFYQMALLAADNTACSDTTVPSGGLSAGLMGLPLREYEASFPSSSVSGSAAAAVQGCNATIQNFPSEIMPQQQQRQQQQQQREHKYNPQYRPPRAPIMSGFMPYSSSVRANHYPIAIQAIQLHNMRCAPYAVEPIWQSIDSITEGPARWTSQTFMDIRDRARWMLRHGIDVEAVLGRTSLDAMFEARMGSSPRDPDKEMSVCGWAQAFVGWFPHLPLPDRAACYSILHRTLTWIAHPTPTTFSAIPSWCRPVPAESYVPHMPIVVSLVWPSLRSHFVQHGEDWVEAVTEGLSVSWPYSDEEVFERDERGRLVLSRLFEGWILRGENWTLARGAVGAVPAIEGKATLR